MLVHWNTKQATIHALLDTGCSTALISKSFVDKMGIPCLLHQTDIVIRNFTGNIVPGAGQEYAQPILLQHRKHYTQEVFKVSPLEPEVDVFLPFWWIAKHPPQGAWDSPELRFSSPACLNLCTKTAVREFSLSLDDSFLSHPEARFIGYVSAVDVTANDSLEQVPEEFRQFLGIMEKDAADTLPEHRSYNHAIDLRAGESALWGPIYPLSEHKLETLREWLKEMLRTRKIQRSTSSAGSPILFISKPNGHGLRLCVDYREINRITIPNRYPLPLMQELQDRIQGAQWFTKMDLKNGFHLIWIKEGDECKTAFRTRYGLYEFLVMPFGLCNAPATFQDMMNHIFRDMLNLGLLAYMDDLLIYAKTVEEHDKIVGEVL